MTENAHEKGTNSMTTDPINSRVLPLRGASQEQVSTRVVEVDPELAAAWLARNEHNRLIRRDTVDALARDMLAGNWRFTAEAIKFGKSGTLLDGQHRLAAIVKSGVTITTLLVSGVPDDAQAVMDTGVRRTAGDALHLAGEANASTLAAVARVGLGVDRGSLAGRQAVTHSEIAAWIAEHPDVRERVSQIRNSSFGMTPAIVSYAFWRLSRIDLEGAEQFFRDLATMRTNGVGDPRWALLQRLATARKNNETLSRTAQLSMIFRAWNALRQGRTLHKMQITSPFGVIEIPTPL